MGIVFMLAILTIEYRHLLRYSLILYILSLGLLSLCFVPHVGFYVKGAYSWVRIVGPLQFQPAEFAKLTTILFLAKFLSARKDRWNNLWQVTAPILIGITPSLMILKQPDFGTATVFAPITLVMMYIAGMPAYYFIYLFAPALCLLGISHDILFILLWLGLTTSMILLALVRKIHWSIWVPFIFISVLAYVAVFQFGEKIWEKMPSHQQARILGYLDPDYDPTGHNFNINQSKIALGSGGFWGKGIGQGTQSKYDFLPEFKHDFVFSIVGEQVGFLGSSILLGLFLLLLIRGVDTAIETKTLPGSLIVTGVISLFFYHIFINVGMVTGLIPVTGLPLTFISYGGTFMLSNMIGVGFLMNVRMYTSTELMNDSYSGGRPTMSIPKDIKDDF